jgi:hypothetical protein
MFAACYPGNYSLVITNTSSSCINSSNRLAIHSRTYPVVAISTPNTYLNCSGLCPILKSSVTGGHGPFAYQWYNNSAIIADATGTVFTACYPGTYRLEVTNTTNYCSNSSNSQVIVDKTCPGMVLINSDSTNGHFVSEGETVTYAYRVTNIGSSNLKNVTVIDDKISNITGPINLNDRGQKPSEAQMEDHELKPGDTWTFEGKYTIEFSDLGGDITNNARAYAEDPAGGLAESSIINHLVHTRPPLNQPTQFGQFCEAKKISGEGAIDSATSIVDKKLALEYDNVMSGDGDMELDQEQVYSQDADKLKRDISAVDGQNQSNLNFLEESSLTYSGDKPLVGGKTMASREIYGGMGAKVQEMYSVNQMEKKQTTFFSTIAKEAGDEDGSNNLMRQLRAAGRNNSRVDDLMGNNSAYLFGIKTTNAFNGTWENEAAWHRIFYRNIEARQTFSGTFEAEKIIKFHESPIPERLNAPCEGIDC